VHYLQAQGADPAALVEQDNYETDANDQLFAALEDLDDRSKDIIQKRWLSDSKATLHELADVYGVSAERIRQLEKNAMKKVKKVMSIEF
jgi:RNA polymerase sigma-32 factor